MVVSRDKCVRLLFELPVFIFHFTSQINSQHPTASPLPTHASNALNDLINILWSLV